MGNTGSDFGFRVIGLRVLGFGSEPCGGGFRVQSLAQEARFAPQLGKRWKLEVWEAWFRVMAFRVSGHSVSGNRIPSPRVWDPGSGVWGFVFEVSGSGSALRVEGVGFRVEGFELGFQD